MVTFSHWVEHSGQTHESIAKQLRVTRAYVSLLASGRKTPSLQVVRRMITASHGALSAEGILDEFAPRD
tara:strand:- start:1811 stop:2017 length:207 start_codon:yes stop_codon:yes gene_type:complete